MAGGGKVSDEKIAEVLIKKVIKEELKDRPLEDVSFLTPDAVEVKNEQEKEFEEELFAVMGQIGDQVKDNKEIQDGIQRLAQKFKQGRVEGANKTFMAVLTQVFQDGITWENISILLHVVGRVVCIMLDLMAGIMEDGLVTALCPSVKLILNWTLDFFKKKLLGWIGEQGGWSCCLVQS